MQIPYEDFIDMHDTILGIQSLMVRMNNELGYVNHSPFEEELTQTLEKLYKYGPDQFFEEIALNIIIDKFSQDRAEKTLIKKYKLDNGRALTIAIKAFDRFVNEER